MSHIKVKSESCKTLISSLDVGQALAMLCCAAAGCNCDSGGFWVKLKVVLFTLSVELGQKVASRILIIWNSFITQVWPNQVSLHMPFNLFLWADISLCTLECNSRNQVIFLWLPTCILLNFQVDMMWHKFAKLSRPEIYTITLHFRDGKTVSWKKYSS